MNCDMCGPMVSPRKVPRNSSSGVKVPLPSLGSRYRDPKLLRLEAAAAAVPLVVCCGIGRLKSAIARLMRMLYAVFTRPEYEPADPGPVLVTAEPLPLTWASAAGTLPITPAAATPAAMPARPRNWRRLEPLD